jgi:hypothetical protein
MVFQARTSLAWAGLHGTRVTLENRSLDHSASVLPLAAVDREKQASSQPFGPAEMWNSRPMFPLCSHRGMRAHDRAPLRISVDRGAGRLQPLGRSGQYCLARLPVRFGPEIRLDDLLDRLAANCPRRRQPKQHRPGKYDPRCHAAFLDLMFEGRPPDLPPASKQKRFSIVE